MGRAGCPSTMLRALCCARLPVLSRCPCACMCAWVCVHGFVCMGVCAWVCVHGCVHGYVCMGVRHRARVCASQLHGLDNGHPLTQTASPVYLCFLRAQVFLPLYICVSGPPPSHHALVGMLSLVCVAHVMMCYCYSCIAVFSHRWRARTWWAFSCASS